MIKEGYFNDNFFLVYHSAFVHPQLVKADSITEALSIFKEYYDYDIDVCYTECDGVKAVNSLKDIAYYDTYLYRED